MCNNINGIANCTLADAISLGKSDKVTIEINGFLAHYFKGYEGELEDILINTIVQKQKSDADLVNNEVISYLKDKENE
jgi:hypothetical protein